MIMSVLVNNALVPDLIKFSAWLKLCIGCDNYNLV